MKALLLLLMVAAAFALWIGVPALILWGLGQVVEDRTEHFLLALLAVPSGMALFGLVLVGLNAAYLRLDGFYGPAGEQAAERVPGLPGPLGRILGISAVVALLALLAWMIFAASGPALGP